MAKAGRRYPLVIYRHMVNRWWPAIFAIGIALLGLAWALKRWGFEEWRSTALGSLGVGVITASFLFFLISKIACVRPYADHFRLITPFFSINVSYKRIKRTNSASMASLFPPKSVSGLQQDILEPIAKMTALVVELNGFPLSQSFMKIFLSPFFFKDKTPHFVILVSDWMKFSAELESMRAGGGEVKPGRKPDNKSILSRLPHK